MALNLNNSSFFSVTVITVCVEVKTAEQAVQAVESMQWVLASSSAFDSYISEARRPYLGPQSKASSACIALVDFDVDAGQAVESTRYLHQVFAGKITVIALAENRDPELLLQAMRAGCSEFLPKPFNKKTFVETLSRIESQWSKAQQRNAPAGTVLAFMGAKGGSGTTTIAVHLATYLSQCHNKRTLLIDNHGELGHTSIYLGLDGSQNHFSEVVRNVSRLDSALLHGFVAKHATGLEVLSSPDVPGTAAHLDTESVVKTLEFLRSEYEYVIVDCATSLDDTSLAVIEASTRLYLVATPEIGAIRDLSRYIDSVAHAGCPTDKMHVVINRFSSRYAVDSSQIEKAIRLPIAIKLPNAYVDLVRSVNLGEPIPANRKSDFAAQIVKWSNTLVGSTGSPAQPKKESSLIRKWK
ncbi:MAG TPA: AAA family ATPase [Acidobacteriaceae bacterium]